MRKKIAFTIAGLVLLIAPLSASAQLITLPNVPQNASVQQLQELIQQLTQILNLLLGTRYPSSSGAELTALPRSGPAPLHVVFTLSAGDASAVNGVYYTIVFGDGQADGFPSGVRPTLSHIYTAPGAYTATVTRRTQCSATECLGPSSSVGSVTITVTGGSSDTCPSANRSPVCSSGSHLVGGQVFAGCRVGGQCVSDTTTSPTAVTPHCTVSYSPSTINRTQTLNINWSGRGASRSFFIRNSATGQTFGTSTILVNGFQQDTSFRTLAYGTYVRTDTVSNSVGTTTCSATLNIVATSTTATTATSTPAVCPVYNAPLCPAGTHMVGGSLLSNGCYGSPQCVSDFGICNDRYGGWLGDKCTEYFGKLYPPTTACPVYQQPLCPAGQHLVNSGNTTDSGGCATPHYSCVADSTGGGSTQGTGTCSLGGYTSNLVTSADGCRSWCSSLYGVKIGDWGEGTLPFGGTCVYRNANGASQVVGFSSPKSNLANALSALSTALKAFLGR